MATGLTWRRAAVVLFVTVLLLGLTAPGVSADGAQTGVSRTTISVTWLGFVPCPTPAEGELVQLSGTQQIIFTFTLLPGGTVGHSSYVAVYQGVSGVGLTSGALYRAGLLSTSAETTNSAGPPPWAITFHLIERFIGAGATSNFTLWSILHITVTPDFQVTSYIDQSRATCG
jgi:hypothetical protein